MIKMSNSLSCLSDSIYLFDALWKLGIALSQESPAFTENNLLMAILLKKLLFSFQPLLFLFVPLSLIVARAAHLYQHKLSEY